MHHVTLRAMATIRFLFGVNIEYSEDTIGLDVPVAAIALGTTVSDKHFTDDRQLPRSVHKANLETSELSAMLTSIRYIEQALGSSLHKPTDAELENARPAGKSIVASKDIIYGDVVDESNITTKHPDTSISPMLWNTEPGINAIQQFAADNLITL